MLAVGLNRAVDLLAKKLASVRNLGPHPKDAAPLIVRKGRFGPYVQHGQMVANLPRGLALEDVTAAQAVALLAEKGKILRPRGKAGAKGTAKGAAKGTAKGTTKQAAAKATPAPRPTAKKPAAKKPATKKPATKKPAAKKPAPRRKAAG